jgi:hypothetical protein
MKSIFIRRVGLPVATAFVVMACAATTVQAATVYKVTGPTSGTVPNPCNGQTVTFSGMAHALLAVTQAPNGGSSATLQANYADVTGTDGLKNTYRVISAGVATITMNGATTGTGVEQLSLITPGSTPNAEAHVVMHITIDANGVTTASFTIASISCTG